MFIDKEEIVEDIFKDKQRLNQLKSCQFKDETLMVVLSYPGYIIQYFSDDKLYKKFKGNLPDNINGEVALFYNVEDLCSKFGI